MRRIALARRCAASTLVLLSALLGCRSGGLPLINLLGIDRPLVLAVGVEKLPAISDQPLDPVVTWARYEPLRAALSTYLNRAVALDMTLPGLIPPLLKDGFYHVAILSPVEFARLSEDSGATAIAVPVDAQNRALRSALLVVKSDSPIRQISELRGQSVAFGLTNDARSHIAALMLLEQNGLKPLDLKLELLPLPGSLKHLPDGRSIAQHVASGGAAAGFVDQAAWDALPATAENRGEPARDQLRAIGQTLALPDRVAVVSGKLEASQVAQVRRFLIEELRKQAPVASGLQCAGFADITPEAISACRRLITPVAGATTK